MEVVGPNEDGSCWDMTIRGGWERHAGCDVLLLVSEADLQPTGFFEDEGGARFPLWTLPVARSEGRGTSFELRLFTDIADGIDAARVAEEIQQELFDLLGDAALLIEAERHWSEPFSYELMVTIEPPGDPAAALQRLADAGGGGWLSCIDDGWGCDLWWSAAGDEEAVFLASRVRGAELAFQPWRSPARRPIDERPIVEVHLQPTLEEPPDFDG